MGGACEITCMRLVKRLVGGWFGRGVRVSGWRQTDVRGWGGSVGWREGLWARWLWVCGMRVFFVRCGGVDFGGFESAGNLTVTFGRISEK